MNTDALIEASKEFARVCVLAVIPIAIDGLANNYIDWRLIGVTAAIAGLRWIDKYLYESGHEKGLTRF